MTYQLSRTSSPMRGTSARVSGHLKATVSVELYETFQQTALGPHANSFEDELYVSLITLTLSLDDIDKPRQCTEHGLDDYDDTADNDIVY
ncbi:hypothetical protein KVT40_002190 [Elsinoe batatas]|uniref:Uncharacterized protein n=1 Tax=Elsinoe batatas TaxID=2601811 RepID=A0A8K0PHZ2_9PEZI|nr:hypothetical protein KVT40_002190 [Elsinoe batatas]